MDTEPVSGETMILEVVLVGRRWLPHEHGNYVVSMAAAFDNSFVLQVSVDDVLDDLCVIVHGIFRTGIDAQGLWAGALS